MDRSSDIPGEARAILDFWFGELDERGLPTDARMQRWFDSDPAFDDEIRGRFGHTLEQARELTGWRSTAAGTLSLVILADQFSRNIHRGTARAFALDDLALALATDALDTGLHRELRPIERVFLYMPLEHAEDPAIQDRSVQCFHDLAGEVPASTRELFEDFAGHAEGHREVIARFGRFPHRNAALGRRNTPEEAMHLESGQAWGQQARKA